MAHQSHNIPWNLLASNLKWRKTRLSNELEITNLQPRDKFNQGKEIAYFVKAFARTIDEHAECERKKFPATYDPPSPDDVIVTDEIAKRITPTVCLVRSRLDDYRYRWEHCRRDDREGRFDPMPIETRKMSGFLRSYEDNPCNAFFACNEDAFFQLQLVETMILYGEMDAVLRICTHPAIGLKEWWLVPECNCAQPNYDIGWDQLFKNALAAYICLNTVYCFPDMWDPESGKTDKSDYRNTRCYQLMLRECTTSWKHSDVIAHPHRRFFGIDNDQFPYYVQEINTEHWLHWADRKRKPRDAEYYGILPIQEFLSLEGTTGYLPVLSDIGHVRWILCKKGLPVELAIEVMDLAGYKAGRRLEVPHDPFHPSNREELSRYLTYCWQIIVRCAMMGKALGMGIQWEQFVADILLMLFSHNSRWKKRPWGCWCDESCACTNDCSDLVNLFS